MGVIKPCRDVKLLEEMIICKKSINFHIKMWAEGYLDMMEHYSYYLESYENYPEWIKISLCGQIKKMHNLTDSQVEDWYT